MRTKLMIAAAVLAMAGQAQAANLIVNGEFSTNTLPALGIEARTGLAYVGAEIDSHFLYDGAITGWSSPSVAPDHTNGYNLYFFDGATATSGNAVSRYPGEDQHPNSNFTARAGGGAFVVLDADPTFTSPLQQTVGGLTVGQSYLLSFWWAAGELSNRTGYQTSQLTGTFGGDAFATSTFFNSHPIGSPTQNLPGDFSGWHQVSFNFTAHTTSQVLSFLAVGSPAGNLPPVAFLDGVSLTRVPEPGVWALMLMGFAGLGVALRRRRRVAAA